MHWKRPWFWEGLGAGGERDNRGWDDWMASPTWWTWVWVNSGSWWWTGRPNVLPFMGLQRVQHNPVTNTFTFTALQKVKLQLCPQPSHLASLSCWNSWRWFWEVFLRYFPFVLKWRGSTLLPDRMWRWREKRALFKEIGTFPPSLRPSLYSVKVNGGFMKGRVSTHLAGPEWLGNTAHLLYWFQLWEPGQNEERSVIWIFCFIGF